MTLDEHKVQNVKMKPNVKDKIKKIGKKLSKRFNRNRVLDYCIQSENGMLWDNLVESDLISIYCYGKEEYVLLCREEIDGDVVFHNLIKDDYISPYDFLSTYGTSYIDDIDIDDYVEKEDIMFRNVLPTIDAGSFKNKIEAIEKNKFDQIKKKMKK